jgi:hypothetical protein
MAGNHTNAYAHAQIDNYSIADTIDQQAKFNLQRKEQKLREQQFEYQKQKDEKEERRKNAKEFWDNAKQIELTGVAPIDELALSLIDQTMNDNLKIYLDMRSGKISEMEGEAMIKRNSTIPTRFKAVTQSYQGELMNVKERLEKGEIVMTPELGRFLKGLSSGKATMRRNQDGTFDFLYDADGDGVVDVITEREFMSKKFTPELIENVNPLMWASNMAKTVGMEEKKWSEGNTDYHTKFAKEGAIENILDTELRNNNKLKGALYALGFEDYNNPSQESQTRLYNYLKHTMNNSINNIDESKVDRGSQLGWANLAQRKKEHNDTMAQKEEKSSIGESVDPTKATWGDHYKTLAPGAKSVSVVGKVNLDAISLLVGKEHRVYSNVTVNNFSYDKNGKMVISGSYPEGKKTRLIESLNPNNFDGDKVSVTENKKIRSSVSKETESRIAKMLNTTTEGLRQRAGFTERNMSQELPDYNELPDL